MTMHIHHPSLSLNGKRKGKIKFASSDAKRKAEQLDKEWKELQKKWGVEEENKKRDRAMVAQPLTYALTTPPGRTTTKHIKSRGEVVGNAPLKQSQVYTGTAIIGVSQMAKSNAIPVFNNEHILEIARMRR